MVPKDICALISRSYEYVITWKKKKKKTAEVVKDIKIGRGAP